MRVLIASLKMLAFAFLTLIAIPPQALVMVFTKGPASRILPFLWMKAACFIFRISVDVEGEIYRGGQVITMSNHLSYLDIPVIGSVLRCSFVSKNDVANWPVFGFLANLRQTAYVSRARKDTKTASNAVNSFIERGEDLIIFPEGTSTDGRDVIDFKSSLFSLALNSDNKDLKIQPLTLHVLSSDKRKVTTQEDRDIYAWHRDMDDDIELPDHLWSFAKARGAEIRLIFHAPIDLKLYDDRKTLAKDTHSAVSNGLQNSIDRQQQG